MQTCSFLGAENSVYHPRRLVEPKLVSKHFSVCLHSMACGRMCMKKLTVWLYPLKIHHRCGY